MVFLWLGLAVISSLIAQYACKQLLKKYSSAKVIIVLYLFCALAALGLWVGNGNPELNQLVVVVGVVNAFGAWAFAQAIMVGFTQSFLLLPLSSIMALFLAAIFLGESHLFNLHTPAGIVTSLGLILSLSGIIFFHKKQNYKNKPKQFWLLALISFIVITGTVEFLSKFFAVNNVPPVTYIISWYAGSFVGALGIALSNKLWKQDGFSDYDWFWASIFAVGTIGSLGSTYLGLTAAPLALIIPLRAFLYTVGGALMGLFIFHEKDYFDKLQIVGLIFGFIGAALLIIGIS